MEILNIEEEVLKTNHNKYNYINKKVLYDTQ